MKVINRPCSNCPFRKDTLEGWLGEERMREICVDTVLGDQYFVYHKTTDLPLSKQALCAGKLILEGKVAPYNNRSTRIAVSLGMFDGYESLKGEHLIFDNVEQTIKHHGNS